MRSIYPQEKKIIFFLNIIAAAGWSQAKIDLLHSRNRDTFINQFFPFGQISSKN